MKNGENIKSSTRLIQTQIASYLSNPQGILVIEGVRQTGKTTAIRRVVDTHPCTFITLTDETAEVVALRQAKTFDEFTHKLKTIFGYAPDSKKILVIDEAQRGEHVYAFIMPIEKEWRGTPVLLSGSVMGAFFHQHDHEKYVSPAGRIKRIICRPFSFNEFLHLAGESQTAEWLQQLKPDSFEQMEPSLHQKTMQLFYVYLTTGGMPQAILRRHNTQELYDYWQTLLAFFWQDADRYLSLMTGRTKTQYGQLFATVLQRVAGLITSPTQRSSIISTDSPAYRSELPEILNAAELWHFLFRLATRMKTLTSKQGTSSKKYLWDVGAVNYFINLSRPVNEQTDSQILAKLLENYVAQELVFLLQTKDRLTCWKSNAKQEKEMDFLACFPEQDVAIEVKASRTTGQKALSQLGEYLKTAPNTPAYVTYLGEPKKIVLGSNTVWLIPPYLLDKVTPQLRSFSSLVTRGPL